MRLMALFAFLLCLSACGSDAEEKAVLRFSAIPDEKDVTQFEEKFGRVAKYLESKLGVPVEYVHALSYEDSVEKFQTGDVQLAWFGGLTGVQARHAVKGAVALAQGTEDPSYYSYFIAHRDSGIDASDDFPAGIEGKRFLFGSKGSTSGRLMPEHFIREHFAGRDPKDIFEAMEFSGAHDKTAELVAAGNWQVGALSYKTFDKLVKKGQIDPDECKVIWRTPGYADYNLTAHPNIDDTFGKGTMAKIQAAFLEMKDPTLLAAFQRSGMIEAKNEDFGRIEGIARTLGFLDK